MQISEQVYQKIIVAKLFMDEHYDQGVDLDIVSGKALISRYHFHRLFTRIYGLTPHRYLTQKRIGQAKKLLAENKFTLSDICKQVGFESVGSFSTLFKKEMGVTPGDYRQITIQRRLQAKQRPLLFIPHCFIDSFPAKQ